ncbi:hypothetical protein [Ideonella sp.]|uniref:hypothetical protein n=1 Tax=Ideonella sp. TaxID=1929293 RepID=UPI0035B24AE5
MHDRDAIDRYFTEQVVGAPVSLTLGPGDTVRREPPAGLTWRLSGTEAEQLAAAARALLSGSPAVPAGQPQSAWAARRARRRLAAALAGLLVAWPALLWALARAAGWLG